jgi:hypothetical protein
VIFPPRSDEEFAAGTLRVGAGGAFCVTARKHLGGGITAPRAGRSKIPLLG